MQIEFLRSVAHARGSFIRGQIVVAKRLPKGWDTWLTAGVIRIRPSTTDEIAVAPAGNDAAVEPRPRRRRAARRKALAD